MTKPVFNATIIDALRQRVSAHNEIVKGHAALEMKLGQAKKLYKRWHSGSDPHAHALAMLDGKLLTMQQSVLEKARPSFEEGEHPRGRGGQFRPTGHEVRQVGLVNRSTITAPDGKVTSDPHLLDAAQVQVIPETRYTVLGPSAAAAAGVGLGALTGATASPEMPWRGGGGALDRAATHVLGRIGEAAGHAGAVVTGGVGIKAPRAILRAAVPAINRSMGTALHRPAVDAGDGTVAAITRIGRKAGRAAGRGIGHAWSLTSWPAAKAGQLAGGGVRGKAVAAAIGALYPGLSYAGSLRSMQERVGPYEDALFPRRVRKAAGTLWDAPEVLAKQEELLGDEDLAKTLLSEEELAKAFGLGAARAGLGAARRYGGIAGAAARRHAAGLFTHIRRPHAPLASPAASVGPTSPAMAAARQAFAQAGAHTAEGHRRNLVGRLGTVAAHGALGSAAGSIGGALTGAGLAAFVQKHPHDPKTGRFISKGQAALHGAKVGAGVGLALGLGYGGYVQRAGHRALVQRALSRLAGQSKVKLKVKGVETEVSLPEALHVEAEDLARTGYAANFRANYKGQKIKLKPLAPGAKPGADDAGAIKHELEEAAVTAWKRDVGPYVKHPKIWYTRQLNEGFDKSVARQLTEVAKQLPNEWNPLKAKMITAGRRPKVAMTQLEKFASEHLDHEIKAKTLPEAIDEVDDLVRKVVKNPVPKQSDHPHLIDSVNVDKLTPAQRKIWDSEKEIHTKALDKIEDVYRKREAKTFEHAETHELSVNRKELLSQTLVETPVAWRTLKESNAPLSDLINFAKDKLGYTVKSRSSKEKAIKEIDDHMPGWLQGVDEEVNRLGANLPQIKAWEKTAKQVEAEEFSAQEFAGVLNPYTGKPFTKRVEGADTPAGVAKILDDVRKVASKDFAQGLKEHLDETAKHLNTMFGAEQAALEAGLPKDGLAARTMHKYWPKLAAHVQNAVQDTAAIMGSHRATLTGKQKEIYDWLHQNRRPAEAWVTAKKLSKESFGWSGKVGKWLREHNRLVISVLGPAMAVGAVDLNAPKGKRFKWPKDFKPNGMRHRYVVIDPVKRPGEVLMGLTYRDDENREKFLTGVHIKNEEGDRYTSIPFGTEFDQIRGQVKGGGSGGGFQKERSDVVPPEDREKVSASTARAEADGLVQQAGVKAVDPGGTHDFTFFYRKGEGGQDVGDAAEKVRKGLFSKHLQFMTNHPGQSSNKPEMYWNAVRDVFESNGAELLSLKQKAGLLFGTGKDKSQRGIFAGGAGQPYVTQPWDTTKVAAELKRQITGEQRGTLKPRDADEYTQMRRVLTVAKMRFDLTDQQHDDLVAYLDKAVPHAKPAAGEGSGRHDFDSAWPDILRRAPHEDRPESWKDEGAFKGEMRTLYNKVASDALVNNPNWTTEQVHRAAIKQLHDAIEHEVSKQERRADLHKLFGLRYSDTELQAPPIGGSYGRRGPERRPPESPGMAPTEAAPLSVDEVGSFGLTRTGYEAVNHIIAQYMPSKSMIANAAQIGQDTLAGLTEVGRPLGLGHGVGTAMDPQIGPAGSLMGGSLMGGALANGGADILHRHLSRYGTHVSQHALRTLGHRG